MENYGPYTPVLLQKGLWAIEEGGVRCFLFEGEDRAMLVDTGFGTGDLARVCRALTPKPIFVVNTHADGDHLGCSGQFGETRMHPAEYARCRENYLAAHPDVNLTLTPLWEGQVISVAPWAFEVLLIPGHTPGSIALLERSARLLVGGDSVQRGDIFMFGPGRNLPAYIAGIEKLKPLANAFDRVLPSHGPLEGVGPEVLDELLSAARLLLAGALQGEEPGRPMPCKLYRRGGVGFLF